MNKILKFLNNLFYSGVKKEGILNKHYNYANLKLKKAQMNIKIFVLYRGLPSNEILDYFNHVEAEDTFEIDPGGYIVVYGLEKTENNLFVYLSSFDINWDNPVGFFHPVNAWPDFMIFKETIEDSLKGWSDKPFP